MTLQNLHYSKVTTVSFHVDETTSLFPKVPWSASSLASEMIFSLNQAILQLRGSVTVINIPCVLVFPLYITMMPALPILPVAGRSAPQSQEVHRSSMLLLLDAVVCIHKASQGRSADLGSGPSPIQFIKCCSLKACWLNSSHFVMGWREMLAVFKLIYCNSMHFALTNAILIWYLSENDKINLCTLEVRDPGNEPVDIRPWLLQV